jgi:hypothetical protein
MPLQFMPQSQTVPSESKTMPCLAPPQREITLRPDASGAAVARKSGERKETAAIIARAAINVRTREKRLK